MLDKQVLLDSNIIFHLCDFEYRCKGWGISTYFSDIFQLVKTGKLIITSDVSEEFPFKKVNQPPNVKEPWERYKEFFPSELKYVFNLSNKLFRKEQKELIVVCDLLMSDIIAAKKEHNQSSYSMKEELICNKRIQELKSRYDILESLDINKLLLKLMSTIKLKNRDWKVTDMKLVIYTIFGNYCISTYDDRIIDALYSSNQERWLVYPHYFINYFENGQQLGKSCDDTI